ncbi:MAG: hypothetical protein NC131_05335 [Roseburia sp.]|nr:hypothetical protein [Roseburia sp.]
MDNLYNFFETVKKNLIVKSGTELSRIDNFDRYYGLLERYFAINCGEWLNKRYKNYGDRASRNLFWEVFAFNELDSERGDSAIKAFNNIKPEKCIVLQIPDFAEPVGAKNCFMLEGLYDTTNLSDYSEFKFIKDLIRQKVAIPFWTIDYLSQHIGKELYVFDDSFKWMLNLTHENEIYFHRTVQNEIFI